MSRTACLPDLPICQWHEQGDKIGGQNSFESIQPHEHQTPKRIYPD